MCCACCCGGEGREQLLRSADAVCCHLWTPISRFRQQPSPSPQLATPRHTQALVNSPAVVTGFCGRMCLCVRVWSGLARASRAGGVCVCGNGSRW